MPARTTPRLNGSGKSTPAARPWLPLPPTAAALDADARPVLATAIEQIVGTRAAVMLTDHTRTAETITGHRTVLLRAGRLTDAGPRMVAISLRCADPDRVVERLPIRGTVQRQPGGLNLRVPAGEIDTCCSPPSAWAAPCCRVRS